MNADFSGIKIANKDEIGMMATSVKDMTGTLGGIAAKDSCYQRCYGTTQQQIK